MQSAPQQIMRWRLLALLLTATADETQVRQHSVQVEEIQRERRLLETESAALRRELDAMRVAMRDLDATTMIGNAGPSARDDSPVAGVTVRLSVAGAAHPRVVEGPDAMLQVLISVAVPPAEQLALAPQLCVVEPCAYFENTESACSTLVAERGAPTNLSLEAELRREVGAPRDGYLILE